MKAFLTARRLLMAFVDFQRRWFLLLCKVLFRLAQLATKASLAAKLPPSLVRAFVHCQCRELLLCELMHPQL
jgi:hypothetical protein